MVDQISMAFSSEKDSWISNWFLQDHSRKLLLKYRSYLSKAKRKKKMENQVIWIIYFLFTVLILTILMPSPIPTP